MISAEIRNVDEHHTRGIFDNLYIVIWRKIAEISVVGVANDLQFMATHFPKGFGFLTICEKSLTASDFGTAPAFQLQEVVSQRAQNFLVRGLVLECSGMVANLAKTNFNVTRALNVSNSPKLIGITNILNCNAWAIAALSNHAWARSERRIRTFADPRSPYPSPIRPILIANSIKEAASFASRYVPGCDAAEIARVVEFVREETQPPYTGGVRRLNGLRH